jgi:hypothetical protein
MSFEFTDAKISDVSISVRDEKGRAASITFSADGIVFHKLRPKRSKAAHVSYAQLLDLAAETNPEFFERPKRRKSPHRSR